MTSAGWKKLVSHGDSESEYSGSGSGDPDAEDDDEHWSSGRSSQACCSKRLALGACVSVLAVILCSLGALVLYANALAKRAVVSVGCESFGTAVHVDSVSVGILSARTAIHGVTVANPPGFSGLFLDLSEGILDSSMWSLWSHKVNVEELALRRLNVTLEQDVNQSMTFTPNFVPILRNLQNASHRQSPIEPPGFMGGKISARKYIVDRLEMKDLGFVMDMQINALDLRTPPVYFSIPRILINDVGKTQGGVSLEDLMGIVVRAVVSAAIEAAPGNFGMEMLDAIKAGMQDVSSLDFDSLRLDLGEGLQQISSLIDRVGQGQEPFGALTRKIIPMRGRPAETVKSAIQTAEDVESELGEAVVNSTAAWGDAISSNASGEQAFVRAVKNTADTFGAAFERAETRARNDGQIGQAVADAINSTQAFVGVPQSSSSSSSYAPFLAPSTTMDLATVASSSSSTSAPGSPAAEMASGTPTGMAYPSVASTTASLISWKAASPSPTMQISAAPLAQDVAPFAVKTAPAAPTQYPQLSDIDSDV